MEMQKQELHISVRNLVEFVFREGDIDNRAGQAATQEAMLEGSRIHRKIQGRQGKNYKAEVPLRHQISEERYNMTIEGRADGIYTEEEAVWIDEIKGMYRRVDLMEEPVFVHQAQAMCYAYIYALQNHLEEIGVRMTYCNLETEDIRYFHRKWTFPELEDWFCGLWAEYHKWADFECRWHEKSIASIKSLSFPFTYREGQKSLITDVYRTILREKILFLQAPTGTGKTISTIFPAVKAVGEGHGDRIFYLTAKTITASVAQDTFHLLMEKGYLAKTIRLTAKEKICFCEETDCNPVSCPYAKGHFDRVNDAVFDLLSTQDFYTREILQEQARKYHVCPFEMSLDLSSFSDNIICDYNYAFDPQAMLRRFFADESKNDYIFLVDEAHNLVDRSREMYSASLCKEDFLAVKKLMHPQSRKIERLLEKCNKLLLEYKRECENYRVYEDISAFMFSVMRLNSEIDEFLQKTPDFFGRKEVLDFYFRLRTFEKIYDLVDERYVIYSELNEEGKFVLKLFCVDPSQNLQKCLDKGRACIFFSATLLPVNYYKEMFSTRTDNYAIYAQSVFSQEQRLLMMAGDVSTRYTRRNEAEFDRMAGYLLQVIRAKEGNYIAFFPSYRMMEQVRNRFLLMAEAEYGLIDPQITTPVQREGTESEAGHLSGKLICMIQKAGMGEEEREAFLAAFEQTDQTLIAFCVMGGIFSEGIDLPDHRLIGVIVAGTGLPQISNEREILKNYYEEHGKNGFDYAFRYPGLNKVLQAAGRVIRTDRDTGVILLMDERFRENGYKSLFPREWDDIRMISGKNIAGQLRLFWDSKRENGPEEG